eukprot:gene8351-9205_t
MLGYYKQHNDCDLWAREHNECVNNPRFMWTSCLGSCVEFATNTHPLCDQWALEGECTNNPSFLHVNCPRSCGMAIVWSPWVRRHFDLEPISLNPLLATEPFDHPEDLFQAAEILRLRLARYFEGLSSIIPGFSSAAPTEYLGMLGLTEALLYALRLHEVIFRQLGESHQIDYHYEKIHEILDVVRQGYSSDRLMLRLPFWMGQLNESAFIAVSLLQDLKRSVVINQTDPMSQAAGERAIREALSFTKLTDYYLPRSSPTSSASSADDSKRTATLNNGVQMPLVGLGTWQLDGEVCYEATLKALRLGYRLIDSAEAYGNEEFLGNALQAALSEGILRREDVFIATKASDEQHMGYRAVQDLVREQMRRLKVDQIDLYFLHSPLRDKQLQKETWTALEELYEQGVIKALGVSNFNAAELSDLLSAARIKPAVLQNKLDIYHLGKQLDDAGDPILLLARQHGIVVMAYSPFSAFPFVLQPVGDPLVRYIASRKTQQWQRPVTPAQILLKWAIQHGVAVIPRSQDNQKLTENLEVLQLPALTDEDMQLLDIIQLLVSSPVSVPVLFDDHKDPSIDGSRDSVTEL